MKKKHPWRQYGKRIFENVNHKQKNKMLPDDVAYVIDVHGYRHPLSEDGAYGLWKTA